MRLSGQATDEVEHLLQVSAVADVPGEHERAVARAPSPTIDEAERGEPPAARCGSP
jgi:hypothetical protein